MEEEKTKYYFKFFTILVFNGTPTLIVFKDGKAVEQMIGVQQADQLKAVIEKHL